ncbi:MAG: hypothetical protein FJX72_06820 [Armatimonadetes bacterium]|nr:hypothetical protein [Armatimonadota bacterium]
MGKGNTRMRGLVMVVATLAMASGTIGWAERPAAPAGLYGGDFGFLWWAHGFRGRSPDGRRLLCVRTSRYGLALDVEKPTLRHFGALNGRVAYERCVAEPNDVVFGLPEAALACAVVVESVTYRCVGAARDTRDEMNYPVRIVELGRMCQRFDVLQLEFADGNGRRLDADGRLEVIAWPDRVAFLLEVTPNKDLPDGSVQIGLGPADGGVPGQTQPWKKGEVRRGYTSRHFGPVAEAAGGATVRAADMQADGRELPVSSDPVRGWTRIELPQGMWRENTDFDHLDRYRLDLRNPDAAERTVRLLFARDTPSPGITGMVAMLRDAQGRPMGIPVQISKNWHRQPDRRLLFEGPWFHGFAMLRLPPKSEHTLELSIAYCRWGGVPSASHAQLCLIGWGVNQQWDQAAIGSWGESICYDPDVNLSRSMVDDIRPLMATAMGTRDGKWGWTNNVGGGDFLVLVGRDGKRLPLTRMRTAYLSQGPNLTRVVYAGVTPGGEVEARIEVSTPRTDDINCAYHRIRYDVRKPIEFGRLAFYQVGADNYNDHRFGKMAYGDATGVREEWPVAVGGRRYHRSGIALAGGAPWVSLHDAVSGDDKGGAWAARGLIVRRWKARLGGKPVALPVLASYGTENGPPSANAELGPPSGLTKLMPGDYVEADLELVIPPIAAADYYGPDEGLRRALATGGNTWRMVHREAVGNDVRVRAIKGRLVRRSPVEVRSSDGRTASVEIVGGLGYVPITFRGLRRAAGHALHLERDGTRERIDQSVHGEDWYQCDRDTSDGTCSLTFNVPVSRGKPGPVRLVLTEAGQ